MSAWYYRHSTVVGASKHLLNVLCGEQNVFFKDF